jgi:uncharacterized protein
MFVGAALIELFLPGAASLKDKRRVVKGLKDRLHSRFGAAAAEVANQDQWQRGTILVSVVGAEPGQMTETLAAVRRQADNLMDAEVTCFEQAILSFEEFKDVR